VPRAVKFGVVREDPELEALLVERTGARAALVVASAGCTALELCARFPALEVTAFDRSRPQLDHVRARAAAAARGDAAALAALDEAGEFEALFRLLRAYLAELVAGPGELEAVFAAGPVERAALVGRWTASPYWPAAFELFFHDALLQAMFGPAATQHADRGSYPGHFRAAFERGLARADAAGNPFLQRLLLGRVLRPVAWLGSTRAPALVEGQLDDVGDLARFGVVSLSNVLDWSDDALAAAWGARLRALRPGAAVLIRQLNNGRAVRRFFEGFAFDDALGRALLARDRSLFYNRIEVAIRT
jgi:S-adenosylmethionine-diacylglycerol 3-amino-3-carboxypropyl transferase